jgi:FtsZ-binding cell division protein ZapB
VTPRSADPLAREEQLEAEQENLRERMHTVAAEERQVQEELEAVRGQIIADELEAARQGKTADTEELRSKEARLISRSRDALDLRSALQREADRVPAQIASVHQRDFDAFAAHAATVTEAAEQALRALEAAYRSAFDCWRRAEAAWSRLTRDIDERGDATHSALSRGKLAAARRVPGWPLPEPGIFATIPQPQPAGWVPPDERSEHGKPGTYRDVATDNQQVVATESAVAANSAYITLDRYGFAVWRRLPETAGHG